MKTDYVGVRIYGRTVVEVVFDDGHREKLPHRVICHSPSGFDWGYGGSGPAELALNILVDALEDRARCTVCKGKTRYRGGMCPGCRGLGIADEVWRAHQEFKWTWIAGLPERSWSIALVDVLEWWDRIGAQLGVQEAFL